MVFCHLKQVCGSDIVELIMIVELGASLCV